MELLGVWIESLDNDAFVALVALAALVVVL